MDKSIQTPYHGLNGTGTVMTLYSNTYTLILSRFPFCYNRFHSFPQDFGVFLWKFVPIHSVEHL